MMRVRTAEQIERDRERAKARYLAHRDEYIERATRWAAEHKDRRREIQNKSDAKHRDRKNATVAKWRQANPEKMAAYAERVDPEYDRKRCAEYRAVNPEKRKLSTAKYRDQNRESIRAYSSEYHKANPEVAVRSAHKRRARKRNLAGTVSPGITQRLMTMQRNRCACCKSDLRKTGYHLDHIMPLYLGGMDDDSNLQLLCPPCNLTKGAKHPIAFMQSRGMLL